MPHNSSALVRFIFSHVLGLGQNLRGLVSAQLARLSGSGPLVLAWQMAGARQDAMRLHMPAWCMQTTLSASCKQAVSMEHLSFGPAGRLAGQGKGLRGQ